MRIKTVFLLIISIVAIWFLFQTPSNDRNWVEDFSTLSHTTINGDLITIENIRNYRYTKEGITSRSYYTQTFDTTQMKKFYFFVEPFEKWDAVAHTFFSFEFENGTSITFSVEARREVGEIYGAIKGLFQQFEVIYVWSPETDSVARRTVWGDYPVYMYEVNASAQSISEIFISLANATNTLKQKPQFYNTLTSTCTSHLIDLVNEAHPNAIGFTWSRYLPGYSDEYLLKKGLLIKAENNLISSYAKNPENISESIRIAIS